MNAEQIAAGLSDKQREAVCYLGGYHDPNTIKSLRRKGLYDRGLLTPFGLEVRAILMKEQTDAR